MQAGKQEDQVIASHLLYLLLCKSFGISISYMFRESLLYCNDLFSRNTKEILKEDGYPRTVMGAKPLLREESQRAIRELPR